MGESPGGRRRAPRESFAERRERRAAIDDPAVVLEAALRFLEARQRSIAEVRRRLTTAGYREELVTAAIERLGDLGMLDDAAFAAQWVESRDRAHPRGEHALMLELRQKGIDASIISATLRARRDAATQWSAGVADARQDPGAECGGADEPRATPDEAAGRKLLARHARALARIPDARKRRQKAYALLARNGFSPETAGTLSRTVVATPPDDDVAAGDVDSGP